MKRLAQPARWLPVIVFPLLLNAFILLNRFPFPTRSLSLSARSGFLLTLAAAFLILYLVYRWRGQWGQTLSLAAVLALYALSLNALWVSGQSQPGIMSGLLPVGDASTYYFDARRLLEGVGFSELSAMRPAFPAFLGALLALTGQNLQAALAVLVGLNALSAYLASREVQRTHGPCAAVAALLLLFLYYRQRIGGTTLTENLGLSLGVLAFALIWRSAGQNDRRLSLAGIFLTAFALNVRPGAFFMLPALILWGGWFFRGKGRLSWSFLGWGALLSLAAFGLNLGLIWIYAETPAVPFSNFSYTLYGLVTGGKGFTQIDLDHPEVMALKGNAQTFQIYRLILEEWIKNPTGLWLGAWKSWSVLFSDSWYSAYAYVSGENHLASRLVQLGLYALDGAALGVGLLGALGGKRAPAWAHSPHLSLGWAAFAGVFLSVPFVPPTDSYGMRLYAVTMWVFAVLPVLGWQVLWGAARALVEGLISRRFQRISRWAQRLRRAGLAVPFDPLSGPVTLYAASLLLGFTLLAPLVTQWLSRPVPLPEPGCGLGQQAAYARYAPGASIHLIREDVFQQDWLPDIHHGKFRLSLHGLSDLEFIEVFKQITDPGVVINALDLKTRQDYWLILPDDASPGRYGVLEICGNWNPAVRRVFTGESARWIAP